MPLSSIVTVVLRLFAVNWFVQGILTFVSIVREVSRAWSFHADYWALLYPAIMLVLSVGLFLWSKLLARIVTPRPDPEIVAGGLTQYDLYCFAFTFLGLYFVLSSIADTLNWLHYGFMVARETNGGDAKRADALYQITRPLITFLAGGASLCLASRLARRLTAIQRKNEGG
jgi:hypothetical protein